MEYSCQYSDQVRKKHKTWHDGSIKFIKSTKRLTLYSLDQRKQSLSSTFMTNSRDLEKVLDPRGFDVEEHRVFGRYVVIISGILRNSESGGHHRTSGDPLALRMKPFKAPRTVANRPLVRHRVVISQPVGGRSRRIRRVCHQPIML
ncbi:Mte1p TDEL_0E01880 [Torulaspora delbrueckii]|uniref:5'-3' DNA helicase ZGRF1-like N-terminal domain-containing protein n=1 Tax=Torulaspora delbrueckii TaxID=4950 RepID=G8ZUY7_TORDE|nr:hypothetical protein TDEL_0E01880 [Torulaspora delbrueckii]CCE92431.1 hypothetical protein TDEL_0E01880 [Torulaspora delbrueckii]